MLHHNFWCWWHWDRVDRHRRHTHARVVAGRFGLGLGQIDIEQGFDDVVDGQGLEVGNGFHRVGMGIQFVFVFFFSLCW